jgi:hypothetical protein
MSALFEDLHCSPNDSVSPDSVPALAASLPAVVWTTTGKVCGCCAVRPAVCGWGKRANGSGCAPFPPHMAAGMPRRFVLRFASFVPPGHFENSVLGIRISDCHRQGGLRSIILWQPESGAAIASSSVNGPDFCTGTPRLTDLDLPATGELGCTPHLISPSEGAQIFCSHAPIRIAEGRFSPTFLARNGVNLIRPLYHLPSQVRYRVEAQ